MQIQDTRHENASRKCITEMHPGNASRKCIQEMHHENASRKCITKMHPSCHHKMHPGNASRKCIPLAITKSFQEMHHENASRKCRSAARSFELQLHNNKPALKYGLSSGASGPFSTPVTRQGSFFKGKLNRVYLDLWKFVRVRLAVKRTQPLRSK